MIPIASPLSAPSIAPICMAVAVPTPCDEAPNAIPFAIGLLIPSQFIIGGAMILPITPATTTTTAVRAGIPPLLSESAMAIGVVTDLGASDAIRVWSAPKSLPISRIDAIPTTAPTVIDVVQKPHCL